MAVKPLDDIYVHEPAGPIFTIPRSALLEILRVAIDQPDLVWEYEDFHKACNLRDFLKPKPKETV